MKKHPLQNRTNVQIKGGGGQRPFEQCSKKLHFSLAMASLISSPGRLFFLSFIVSISLLFFVFYIIYVNFLNQCGLAEQEATIVLLILHQAHCFFLWFIVFTTQID